MTELESLAKDAGVLLAQVRAELGKVPGPQALLARVQGIDFTVGETVIDTVTGQEVEVVGTGIENIASESTEP